MVRWRAERRGKRVQVQRTEQLGHSGVADTFGEPDRMHAALRCRPHCVADGAAEGNRHVRHTATRGHRRGGQFRHLVDHHIGPKGIEHGPELAMHARRSDLTEEPGEQARAAVAGIERHDLGHLRRKSSGSLAHPHSRRNRLEAQRSHAGARLRCGCPQHLMTGCLQRGGERHERPDVPSTRRGGDQHAQRAICGHDHRAPYP